MFQKILETREVIAGFTDRWGGVSKSPYNTFNLAFHVGDEEKDVLKNRKLLAKELGIKLGNFAWMNQVHSDKIAIVTKGGEVLETDGLITTQSGLALLVLVADCIPILFYDSKRKLVAVAHAGREGSFLNIVGKMILKLKKEFNSKPEDIKVFLGPSIQKECYRVDREIIERFEKEWGKKYIYNETNLDLPLLNQNQLLETGVKKENIFVSKICNHCDRNYFSYRRAENNQTGRFAGIIKLNYSKTADQKTLSQT